MRPPWWLWLTVFALVVALFYGGACLRRAREHRRMRHAMQRDATDPFKRWVACVACVISGDCDYAYLARDEAREVLRRWWAVEHPVDLRQVLDELERSGQGEPAWNLVRFVVLTRLGVGAGFVPEGIGWRRLRPVARRLQTHYAGFDAIAGAYLAARRRWLELPEDGSGDDDETRALVANIEWLKMHVWPQVAFEQEL